MIRRRMRSPSETMLITRRMTRTPIPFSPEAKVDRLLAIPTLPPSPLTSYSSPLPQIPSPPLPVSSPLPMSPPPLPASPTHPLGYRAAMIRLRAESPSTSHPLPLSLPIVLPHTRASMAMMRAATPSTYILAPRSETSPSGTPPLLPIPLPTSSPPLLLPSIDFRVDVPEVTLSPRKRLCSSAPTARPTGRFRADYGFIGTLDAKIRRDPDREIELGQRMTDFVTTVRQDTDEIYGRLDDAQDDRLLMSGQLNLLCRDRSSHARTARLMEGEARASRETWVQSMDASDTARSEVRALRTTVLAHQFEIGDLRAADCKRHTQLIEALTLLRTLKAPRTKTTPATTTTTITLVTDEQLKTLIAQGVADVLAEREATRSKNGKDSHDLGTGVRRQAPLARECTYPDFMKCKPLYFKGIEGVVELTQWFEIMETVFRISNYTVENQIKFATCTLLGSDLTWLKDAIEFTTELMDKKISTFAERQPKNKRKFNDTSRNNQNQQQQNKRQYTSMAYTTGSGEKKPYEESKPLCSKCNYHHDGQCAPKCHKCNRVGYLARDCRSPANANTANNQRGIGAGQKATCFECGARGHFKRECP
ncbi:putative reverse transcriptase domain-containing protein, partial [Tanacetum coccineum]